MSAAEAILEAMERSGLSKKALCEAAGVSRSSLDSYLKGERQPSVAQLERIGEAAGLRMDISWQNADLAVDVRPSGVRPTPSWIIPDNPTMRPPPLSVADRAVVLARVMVVAVTLQRVPAKPELEMPPFRTFGEEQH